MRDQARMPPEPPGEALQAALHACADPPAPAGPVKPAWWGTVCWNREEFSDSIWRFTTDGNEVFY
eukprot:2410701-Lingulodinium_polyedra.AAC.1